MNVKCRWIFGGHEWEYEKIRTVAMFRQTVIGDVAIRDRVEFTIEKQRRTCHECGVTQDRKVGEY